MEKDKLSTLSSALLNEDDKEVRFLNCCLADPIRLHTFVTASLCSAGVQSEGDNDEHLTSSLLQEDVQAYLKSLLAKLSASSALRRKLTSGNTLYYLQCLTEDKGRVEFISSVSDPAFVATSLR